MRALLPLAVLLLTGCGDGVRKHFFVKTDDGAHLKVLHESLPADFEDLTILAPAPTQEMTHDAVLRDLISVFQTTRTRLRCALSLAERENDMLTASILEERIEEHDLSTHMIRSSFGDLLPDAAAE